MEFSFDKNSFSSLISNSILASLYDENGKTSGVRTDEEASKRHQTGGSSDIGNVSHVVPTIHPEYFIGPATPHTKEFAVYAGWYKFGVNILSKCTNTHTHIFYFMYFIIIEKLIDMFTPSFLHSFIHYLFNRALKHI